MHYWFLTPFMGHELKCEPLSSAWMTSSVRILIMAGWQEDSVPGVLEIISITGLNHAPKRWA